MRTAIILPGILLLISLISCKKEDNDEIFADSSFYAMKNGSKWVSTCSWANYISNEKKFVIVGAIGDPDYYQDEQLRFDFSSTDISKSNTVTIFNSRWDFIVGGDAVSDSYFIDSTFHNLVQIATWDTVNKQIRGTFSVRLIRDKGRSDKGEEMLFNCGHFSLNYSEDE